MNRLVMVVVLGVLALGGWAQDGTMMKSEKLSTDGSAMKGPGKADPSAYEVGGWGPQVVAFTTEATAWQRAKTQTVVYFFAATWCPTCQAFYQDLGTRRQTLPANVALVFVNYDKSYDLKKKYGVTAQHTFVVVGPEGQKKKVWNGSASVAEFAKALGS